MQTASKILLALVLVAGGLIVSSQQLFADEGKLNTALSLFAGGSFSDTIKAVDEIAASGVDHAPAVLTALSKRRLYLSKDNS